MWLDFTPEQRIKPMSLFQIIPNIGKVGVAAIEIIKAYFISKSIAKTILRVIVFMWTGATVSQLLYLNSPGISPVNV